MISSKRIEIGILGMDCVECTQHVQKAISSIQGVNEVEVFLSAEKAIVNLDPEQVTIDKIAKVVSKAGYSIKTSELPQQNQLRKYSSRIMTLFGFISGVIILIVVLGEWLGILGNIKESVPFVVGILLTLISGLPIFNKVIRAAINKQIISHTLMSLGVVAALVVGEWTTAMVVVFFMHIGNFIENITSSSMKKAVKDLSLLAPQRARVEVNGVEKEVIIKQVQVGDIVIVRQGEKIPVDGEVISGRAVVDQKLITGESIPVDAAIGTKVFSATMLLEGSLKISSKAVGIDSTFGRVIRLVEEAENNRSEIQGFADKFSSYYLPIVLIIAGITFLISKDPLASAAVLLVACSCTIALATPIAMMASIGAEAKNGVLIKGGKYLEELARSNVLLIDKTGTLTLGKLKVVNIVSMADINEDDILRLAASTEKYANHPIAKAILEAAIEKRFSIKEPEQFESLTGVGARVVINGNKIQVGKFFDKKDVDSQSYVNSLQKKGHTVIAVRKNDQLIGLISLLDTLRQEIPNAIMMIRNLGINKLELLTGDNEKVTESIAAPLGLPFRANLLPEDKIRIVEEYQKQGYIVTMIGDGVNDAPALAQANIGIAMGTAGAEIAVEAAHISLMREDWMLVPHLINTAKRSMRVVRGNLIFTAVYNTIGLTLAAFGLISPVTAAVMQSIPDLGILGNSARLLRVSQ